MASKLKGIRNLRTLSGRVEPPAIPYRAYMQITCLEMEKVRRGCERRSAAQRISEIDERLGEIEAEKAQILETLSAHESANTTPVAATPKRPGFRIRY